MTPAGTSNEFDVQNEWEENTHNTHAADMERKTRYIFSRLTLVVLSIFKRPFPQVLDFLWVFFILFYFPVPYFGLACDHGNSFLCLEE